MAKSPAIPKELRDATRGLSFPSETDSAIEAFAWPAGPVTTAGVRAAIGVESGATIEEQSVAEFFRAVPSSLRGNYFPLLVAIIDQLSGVKVFKVGEIRMTAYVVGTTDEGIRAGVKAVIVET